MGEILAFTPKARPRSDADSHAERMEPDTGQRRSGLEAMLARDTDEFRKAYLEGMACATMLLGHRMVATASQIAAMRGLDAHGEAAVAARRDLEAMANDEDRAAGPDDCERAMRLTLAAIEALHHASKTGYGT